MKVYTSGFMMRDKILDFWRISDKRKLAKNKQNMRLSEI